MVKLLNKKKTPSRRKTERKATRQRVSFEKKGLCRAGFYKQEAIKGKRGRQLNFGRTTPAASNIFLKQ